MKIWSILKTDFLIAKKWPYKIQNMLNYVIFEIKLRKLEFSQRKIQESSLDLDENFSKITKILQENRKIEDIKTFNKIAQK